MNDSVLKQVANLKNMGSRELKNLYVMLNGSEPPSYSRDFIIKRLAYRLQELAYGGLSQEAHKKMDAVLKRHGYDENGMPTRRSVRKSGRMVGSKFIREWNGNRYEVTSLSDGFEYSGRKYRSLSAIASEITGTHWNGRVFFGVAGRSSK